MMQVKSSRRGEAHFSGMATTPRRLIAVDDRVNPIGRKVQVADAALLYHDSQQQAGRAALVTRSSRDSIHGEHPESH